MILDFFKEDFSEVIGAYYDGEKIILARHFNDTVESAEINFTTSTDDEISEIEQLAEKICFVCSQRGWKTSQMGFCLREGSAVTFQTLIVNIPQSEIDDAVKSWAIAQIGKDALYTSIKTNGEIWMAAILKSTAEEYVTAWKKNSMTLRALTVMPEEFSAQINLKKSIDYANFAAEIIKYKKVPNLISNYLSAWNYKKISATIIAIFFCVLLGISVKISYEYYTVAAQLEEISAFIAEHEDELTLKNSIEENISEMKRLNELCAAQFNSIPTFNALVNLGKIADGKTYLTKINVSANSIELEGIANDTDEIKNYVSRLKSNITPNVKLGHFSSNDGNTTFTIHLTLK